MAPFRRGRSSHPSAISATPPLSEPAYDDNDDDGAVEADRPGSGTAGGRLSSWEARRRRKANPGNSNKAVTGGGVAAGSPAPTARSSSSRRSSGRIGKVPFPDNEYDPYDSDPGESYRDHCQRIKGERNRSCLAFPRFLKETNLLNKTDRKVANASGISGSHGIGGGLLDTSVTTAPPSPLHSELDDAGSPFRPDLLQHEHDFNPHPGSGSFPASLPPRLARVRYSLRTSIGDGSDVQPNMGSTSMMERRELRPNNVHINVSHWSDFGGREYMEDRYAIEDMGAVQVELAPVSSQRPPSSFDAGVEVTFGHRKNRRLKMPLTWLGIFDGHGGDKASQFCADWLSSYVRNEESYPFDLGYSMKDAFSAIDEDFVATGHPDGTTACAATLVGGSRIVCANAGDSRAIIVRNDGTVVRLSRDHKPGMPEETRRISELGGRVIYWGRWRVEGLLAVSRSIGDASLKPYVCADPEVCEYDIGKDDWFLIMSSDGVWDVMDNEEAAHVVIASSCVMDEGRLKIDTNRFKWAARNLCDHAKSCGSTDNFSAIVVDLKSCGNPHARVGQYLP